MRYLALLGLLAVGCGGAMPTALEMPPACPPGAGELLGLTPIHRPLAGLVVIRPSREILADANAMRAHVEAAAEATSATGGQIVFRVSVDEDAAVVLFSRIAPEQASAGAANRRCATRTRHRPHRVSATP